MTKKTKNLILWSSIGLILLFGIGMFITDTESGSNSKTPSPVTNSAGALNAVESNYDFGTISMKDGIVSYTFEIQNNGTEPVEIGDVYTSCACTTAYVIDSAGKKYGKFGMKGHSGLRKGANVEVAPGESAKVEAVYDPAFHGPSGVGLIERSVYVETNSKQEPNVELRIRAMVTR